MYSVLSFNTKEERDGIAEFCRDHGVESAEEVLLYAITETSRGMYIEIYHDTDKIGEANPSEPTAPLFENVVILENALKDFKGK